MINIIISVYTFFYSKKELREYKSPNNLFMWIITSTMIHSCRFILYYTLKIKRILGFKPNKLNPDGNIIASLTSFPARINDIWIVVDSIMRQKVKPNRIVLNLTKEEFPNRNSDLPQNLKAYLALGLEVVYRDSNLRSHLKYYYVIKDNPNSLVITIDDDFYYQSDTIERLISLYKQHPNAVCSNRIREISFDENNMINPYLKWRSNQFKVNTPSHLFVALGYGGVLYPTDLFIDDRLFDQKIINETCLKADDLWLKAFELLNNIPVATGEYFCMPAEIRGSQVVSLMSSNCDTTLVQNDVQWNNIDSIYHINELLKSY